MNSSKPPRIGGGPSVRQMRGPGMNKGLKKPRHGKFYSPDAEEKAPPLQKTTGGQNSYLSDSIVSGGRKKRPAGNGKVISSKNI